MKLCEVPKKELDVLEKSIESEAWECLYNYLNDNDLDDDVGTIQEYFDEAMEDLWSDAWVEFLEKYDIQAQYNVMYDGDEIQVDFWDV